MEGPPSRGGSGSHTHKRIFAQDECVCKGNPYKFRPTAGSAKAPRCTLALCQQNPYALPEIGEQVEAPLRSHDFVEARLRRVCEFMEPCSVADREMRIDYAPSSIAGRGQLSRADNRLKAYNCFNSQPFPRILASLSRPLEPLQHAYKIFNMLAKSREESRPACEEFLIAKMSPRNPRHWHTLGHRKFAAPSTATRWQAVQKYFCVWFPVHLLEINNHLYALSAVGASEEVVGMERNVESNRHGGQIIDPPRYSLSNFGTSHHSQYPVVVQFESQVHPIMPSPFGSGACVWRMQIPSSASKALSIPFGVSMLSTFVPNKRVLYRFCWHIRYHFEPLHEWLRPRTIRASPICR